MINKAAKRMLFEAAATVKNDKKGWSNRSCVEEALRLCAGISSPYIIYLDSLTKEFEKYLSQLTKGQ